VSLTVRATKANLVARLQRAVSRPLAPPVEEREAQYGGVSPPPRRCTAGLGSGGSQPPSGFIVKLPPTVPKHPMQNLWHAIEPEFLAEGVASVSQDRRRGAGSTRVSTASLPLPHAIGSPLALSFAPRPRPSLMELASPWSAWCTALVCDAPPPRWDGEWAVPRWCVEGLAALEGHVFPRTTRCNISGMQ